MSLEATAKEFMSATSRIAEEQTSVTTARRWGWNSERRLSAAEPATRAVIVAVIGPDAPPSDDISLRHMELQHP